MKNNITRKIEAIKFDQVHSILFICTGNMLRSPFAEVLLKKLLTEKNITDITVSSAGIYSMTGFSPPLRSQEIALEFGVDLSEFKSDIVSQELINAADLILIMEKTHSRFLSGYKTRKKQHILYLGYFEYSSDFDPVIEDPVGKNDENLRFIFFLIQKNIHTLFEKILKSRIPGQVHG